MNLINLNYLLLLVDGLIVFLLIRNIKSKEYLLWMEQSIIGSIILLIINLANLYFASLYLIFVWFVVFAINFYWPKFLQQKFDYAIYLPNEQAINYYGKLLKIFLPGSQGLYYAELAQAYIAIIHEKNDEAKSIIESISQRPLHPLASQNLVVADMVFLALAKNWPKVIENYNLLKEQQSPIINFFHLSAARAYLQLGDYEHSLNCFSLAKLDSQINTVSKIALFLIPFYANLGFVELTAKLLDKARYNKFKLTNYYKNYILALANKQDIDLALNYLNKARKFLESEKASIYWYRSCNHLEELILTHDQKLLDTNIIKSFQLTLNKCYRSVFIVNTVTGIIKFPKTVVGLILLMIFVYFYEVAFFDFRVNILADNFHYEHFLRVINEFALAKITNINDLYRLFTYSFLHANLIHLTVNLIGLFWFGPIIIQIFGLNFFLILWIFGAVFGGIFHCLYDSHLYVVGCSASLMALWGAYLMALFNSNEFLDKKFRNLEIRICLMALVIQFIVEHFTPQIDSQAHLGGIVIGIVLAAFSNWQVRITKLADIEND